MSKDLTPHLPYCTHLLGAYRPPDALPEYISHLQIAFELHSNILISEVAYTPTSLTCMVHWLQMGVPHRIPEVVLQSIVRDNTDERIALLLLARLTRVVIIGLSYCFQQGKKQVKFAITIPEHIELGEAFRRHWEWLCTAFAPHLLHAPKLLFSKNFCPYDTNEIDVALFLTNDTEFSPYLIDYLEETHAPIHLAIRTATTCTIFRQFTKVDINENKIAYQQLLTLNKYQHTASGITSQELLQGQLLCHSGLHNILAPLLYATIVLGHQVLIVLPHEIALRTTKHALESLGIDAICSINISTTSSQWIEKWKTIINHQRAVVLCVSEQLLHPFWPVCAKEWQPDHILYAHAEYLSPWCNPTAVIDLIRWQRLQELFPEGHYLLQSSALTEQDTLALKKLLPSLNELGTYISNTYKQYHDNLNTHFVQPSVGSPTSAYQQAKQHKLEKCLMSDKPRCFALLCPHTKGRIGVSDSVYMGMATRMRLRYDEAYDRPICNISTRDKSQHLNTYLNGKALGAVAYIPLMEYVLPKATSIYALGMPNTWSELNIIKQQQIPTTFILADLPEEEAKVLRFRLHASFSNVEREFTLAMLLLKAIITGVELSFAYPSTLSHALDNSLEQLGHTLIAQHHSEADKPQRYQRVILQTLATLQAAECIASFSYSLDNNKIEAEAILPVNTYKLKNYIEERYTTYYPHFLNLIERLVDYFYSPKKQKTNLIQASRKEEVGIFSWGINLWQRLINRLKD